MRPPILALATFLVMPTATFGQSLDIADDSAAHLSETEDSMSGAPPDAEDLEGQLGSDGQILLEPKFDMAAEQPDELDNATGLDQTDPKPAPGLVIKIPTN